MRGETMPKGAVSYAYFRHSASVYEQPNRAERKGRQFVQFLPLLVRGHHSIWPEWDLIIHHDEAVTQLPYWACLVQMEQAGLLELRPYQGSATPTLCGLGGMLERLRPAFEVKYDYVICRDVDSIPTPRDKAAVQDFIKSGAAFHVIHDNPSHGGLMGGTLGIHCYSFESLFEEETTLEELLALDKSDRDWNKHGADQDFLNQVIYPLTHHQVLVHELARDRQEMKECNIRQEIESFWGWNADHPKHPGIGVCDEPGPWLRYFDDPGVFPDVEKIRECEGDLYMKNLATPEHGDIQP